MAKIRKAQLIDQVNGDVNNYLMANRCVTAVFQRIAEAMKAGHEVQITNFGTFHPDATLKPSDNLLDEIKRGRQSNG